MPLNTDFYSCFIPISSLCWSIVFKGDPFNLGRKLSCRCQVLQRMKPKASGFCTSRCCKVLAEWWLLKRMYMIVDDAWRCLMTVDDAWWCFMIVDCWWCLTMLDDGWWCLMMLHDCWWLMMVDDGWLWLMIVDDAWRWLMMVDEAWGGLMRLDDV